MQVLTFTLKQIRALFVCGLFAMVSHVVWLCYPLLFSQAESIPDLSVLRELKIVIDPGHGGIDNGATRHNTIEKELNLAIALKTAEMLNQAGAVTILTRSEDVDYYTKGKGGKRNDLMKRIEIITASQPRMFISIHANAIPGSKWTGAQVFYNPRVPDNKLLAQALQEQLHKFPPGNHRQAKEDLNIFLLKALDIPGVLVETGYISNPTEAANLKQPQYQQELAQAIVNGLAIYLQRQATN